VLLAVAMWRASIDWGATIGAGYAFRLASVGQTLETAFPGLSEAAWLHSPVGTALMAVPLALVPALAAGLVWVTRPRRARGRG
jgi:hypothetical protein